MDNPEPAASDRAESDEIAMQVQSALQSLLNVKGTLRTALQWMTRERGNTRKLSTLRSVSRSFEHQLSRTRVLADEPGYLRMITAATRGARATSKRCEGPAKRCRRGSRASFSGWNTCPRMMGMDCSGSVPSSSSPSTTSTRTGGRN
jgi:hypothetical protein